MHIDLCTLLFVYAGELYVCECIAASVNICRYRHDHDLM